MGNEPVKWIMQRDSEILRTVKTAAKPVAVLVYDESEAVHLLQLCITAGLDVPDEIIQDRIAGRRTCPNCKAGYHARDLPPKVEGICDQCGTALVIRKDDNPETVRDRLVVYHRQTEPLIAYYREKGLLRVIDGNQGPENNAKAFLAAM
jgi:adenylate kinase family enzyme